MTSRACAATFLFILLITTGCSRQDFSGIRIPRPFAGGGTESVDEEDRRNQQIQSALATSQALQADAPDLDYELGPNDRLSISIFALESPDKTSVLDRRVQKDSTVSLPWVGKVSCLGATVGEFEARIRTLYAGRYLKDPQVAVSIAEHQSVTVVMTGAVRNPGVYHLKKNRSTVLEMLATAGGLRTDAGDTLHVMRTPETAGSGAKPVLIPVNLGSLLDDGDLSRNISIGGGDILTVTSRADDYFFVLGYVNRPGSFPLSDSQRLDTVRAIALAGGLSSSARAENSFLVQETDAGQQVSEIDLSRIANGEDPPVYLGPGDTLIVGSSFLARLAEFIKPSVGAGVTYSGTP